MNGEGAGAGESEGKKHKARETSERDKGLWFFVGGRSKELVS